jgi:membrane associated rhomboid family serine protease
VNWSRVQWKWRLFKQRLRERAEGLAPGERTAAAGLKACRQCRALISRSARTCPECGAKLGWFSAPARPGPEGGGFFAQSPTTASLLAVMLILFLATWAASGLGPHDPAGRVLFRFGANNSFTFQLGEYWRLLTAVFLHGGFAHIMFNSVALYSLGREVESVYGWARTLIFFVGAGVAGSIASTLLNDRFLVGVGASGAIFGLIGVIAVFGYRRGGAYGRGVMRIAIQWAVFSLVFGFLMGADNWAHLGGLIGGAALAFVVPLERDRVSIAWNTAGILSAALVPLAFFFAFMNPFPIR